MLDRRGECFRIATRRWNEEKLIGICSWKNCGTLYDLRIRFIVCFCGKFDSNYTVTVYLEVNVQKEN